MGVFKRGFAPLSLSPPLFIKERGIKGERLLWDNNIFFIIYSHPPPLRGMDLRRRDFPLDNKPF